MSELLRLQSRFYALVTAPEPVPADVDAGDFHGDGRASAADRLNVYANMYFFRIRDVLAEQFPRLYESLGEAKFHNLVTAYLLRFPPAHPSLRNVGSRLPGWVAEGEHRELASLALLEWTYVDLFDAADAQALGGDAVHELAPESLGELRVGLIPAHRLLPGVLVWRQDFQVRHRAVDEVEAEVIGFCARGTPSFAEACERLAELVGEDEAALRAFQLLARWLADGLIRR